MKLRRTTYSSPWSKLFLSLLPALLLLAAVPALAQPAAPMSEAEAVALGTEAYIYGYPLVIMDVTKRKITNVAAPGAMAAPINQFANLYEYPTAAFKDVVRPNVDTLYSSAWLDLTKEPIILSVPDTHGRYYLMPMLDAWTNIIASPGKRTTGTKAGNFAIVGPGWQGTLPAGVKELKSPTNTVWIIGRTQAKGPADYKAVNDIQHQYKLTPLSAFGKSYTPPPGVVDPSVDMKTPPVEQVAKMNAATFLKTLAALLKSNPSAPADAPMVQKLAKIGILPGQDFDMGKLDPAVARGLERGVKVAREKLSEAAKTTGQNVNGWNVLPPILGDYGTDYPVRALVAIFGLGANLPKDAIYPTTYVDGKGEPLDGAHRYVLHFAKGQTPPANAFWSVTMYSAQSFLVANPINRYAISSWMPLKLNPDGSVDLYIQARSPGKGKESNWLPASPGPFNMSMRIYWPKPAALDGTWKPPAVKRVD